MSKKSREVFEQGGFGGNETILYDAMIVGAFHFTFVKTHREHQE